MTDDGPLHGPHRPDSLLEKAAEQLAEAFGVERQLDKVRPTRLGRAATRWISSDSDVRFATSAALTCAIVTVTLGRSVGGRPLDARRVRLAAISYALFSVGVFTIAGVVAGEALHAL